MARSDVEPLVTAKLKVVFDKPAVLDTYGNKIEFEAVHKELADITITASSLETLLEKLHKHVDLIDL